MFWTHFSFSFKRADRIAHAYAHTNTLKWNKHQKVDWGQNLSVYHSRDLFDQHTRGWNAIKDSLWKCLSVRVYSVPNPLRNHPLTSRLYTGRVCSSISLWLIKFRKCGFFADCGHFLAAGEGKLAGAAPLGRYMIARFISTFLSAVSANFSCLIEFGFRGCQESDQRPGARWGVPTSLEYHPASRHPSGTWRVERSLGTALD